MSSVDRFSYDPAVKEMRNALLLAQESNVDPKVQESIKLALDFVEMREDTTERVTSKESEARAKITETALSHDWKGVHERGETKSALPRMMLSGLIEGQFLKAIVSIHNAKRVLDVGMFTGYSALSMAEALPADGELITLDVEPYLKTLADSLFQNSPHYKKIKIVLGNALNSMKDMASKQEQFDVIFVDADKGNYIQYVETAFESLLKPRGTVLVDNAFMHGKGYLSSKGDHAVKRFLEQIITRHDLHRVLIPMRDGVLLLRRLSDVEGAV